MKPICSLHQAAEQLSALYEKALADIRDISNRLIRILSGACEQAMNRDGKYIVCADDLAPSCRLHRRAYLPCATGYEAPI